MNDIVLNEDLNNLLLIINLLLICINYKSIYINKITNNVKYISFGFFIFLFSLYYRPAESDFWYTLSWFQAKETYGQHFEDIYVWLKDSLNNNYIYWRSVVWGISTLLTLFIFKILKVDKGVATVIFLTFTLIPCFYYLRNTLGFTILYIGVILFLSPIKYKLNYILSILIILLSWYFHKSMPLYIIISVIALIIPLNKYLLYFAILFFVFLYSLIIVFSDYLLTFNFWLDASRGQDYLNDNDSILFNTNGLITYILINLPYLYIIFKYVREYSLDLIEKNKLEKTFFLIFFILYYLSILFNGQSSLHISRRFWNTSMLPFAIFLILYITHNKNNLTCKRFVNLTFISFGIKFLLSLR